MSDRGSNNIRYFLNSKPFGKVEVGDIIENENDQGDSYSLAPEANHYEVERRDTVTLLQEGYNYLRPLLYAPYGPSTRVQFIVEKKDDLSTEQEWKVVSDLDVNMYTLKFDDETDNRTVVCELKQGTDLDEMSKLFNDEFDLQGPDAPELPFVSVRYTPRKFLKRSAFSAGAGEVDSKNDQGATARAVPLELVYSSQPQFVGEVSQYLANSVNDTYATLTTSGNTIITNAPIDATYILNGTVEIEITQRALNGYLRMDLVRYDNEEALNFDEIVQSLGSTDPAIAGGKLRYDFSDYVLEVKKGDSIGIMTLSDTGSIGGLDLAYKTTDITSLKLETDDTAAPSSSKALLPRDAFKYLARIATDNENLQFASSIFKEGGRHETKLLVHGTWLRNMPVVINEGEEDERRLQAKLSLEDLYGAYSILEPLRYDVVRNKGRTTFVVGAEKDIQQNFIGIEIPGEVTDKGREILTDNYYRVIKIGSETSGSNYGEVNNLYSISGYGEWNTVHTTNDAEYEVVTDMRTGAEDIEIQRLFQYPENPDVDGEYDNDWFLVDAIFNGVEYVVKDWTHYYDVIPSNVYDPASAYNYPFTPIEMLRGHGYKINACLQEKPAGFLRAPRGNCNLSIITQKANEDPIQANQKFPHSLLERPRVRLEDVSFTAITEQEVADLFRSKYKGVDRKFGLIKIVYNGNPFFGRLIEGDTKRQGEYQLIEAVL